MITWWPDAWRAGWATCCLLTASALDTAVAAESAGPAQKIEVPREAAAYRAEFDRIQGATSPQSIEALFEQGERVKAAFHSPANEALLSTAWEHAMNSPRGRTELDLAVETWKQQRPGYQIMQGAEVFYDHADAEAFMGLARNHGQPVDREFFALYQASFPVGESWPAHLEQQTDISGCVKFGGPEFIGHYTRWQNFLAGHGKGFYADRAKTYLSQEKFDVTWRCSCDSVASTLTGLRRLEKAAPPGMFKDRVSAEIRRRTGSATRKDYRHDGACQAE